MFSDYLNEPVTFVTQIYDTINKKKSYNIFAFDCFVEQLRTKNTQLDFNQDYYKILLKVPCNFLLFDEFKDLSLNEQKEHFCLIKKNKKDVTATKIIFGCVDFDFKILDFDKCNQFDDFKKYCNKNVYQVQNFNLLRNEILRIDCFGSI